MKHTSKPIFRNIEVTITAKNGTTTTRIYPTYSWIEWKDTSDFFEDVLNEWYNNGEIADFVMYAQEVVKMFGLFTSLIYCIISIMLSLVAPFVLACGLVKIYDSLKA